MQCGWGERFQAFFCKGVKTLCSTTSLSVVSLNVGYNESYINISELIYLVASMPLRKMHCQSVGPQGNSFIITQSFGKKLLVRHQEYISHSAVWEMVFQYIGQTF
jgi:hypothetical protein